MWLARLDGGSVRLTVRSDATVVAVGDERVSSYDLLGRRSIFLGDANALCISHSRLMEILEVA